MTDQPTGPLSSPTRWPPPIRGCAFTTRPTAATAVPSRQASRTPAASCSASPTGVWSARCARKLFRREVFDGLRLDAEGPFLSAELLIKLRARGVRSAQVGVNHYPRAAGTNTGASIGKILRTFRDLAVLRWALWTRRAQGLGTRRDT